jgi:hypothetical protein
VATLKSFEETCVSRLNLGLGGIVPHRLWDKFKVQLSAVESMGLTRVNLFSSFGPNSLIETRSIYFNSNNSSSFA